MKHSNHWLFLLATCLLLPAASATPITSAGQQLAETYDSMNVSERWLAGQHVDWKTGEPDGKRGEHASHCSGFVAAACDQLGAYILRPPQHGQTLLANAQHAWLINDGGSKGWVRIHRLAEAQDLANRGFLVVASYKSPDPERSGHICLVRPADKSAEQIENEGPEVISVGMENYPDTTMKQAFSHHPGAFSKREISLFVHATPFSGPVHGQD